MECGKPCYDRDVKDYCDECEEKLERAAIESALNMGPAEKLEFVGLTDEEVKEVFDFLDKNKELMEDLVKQGD